MIDGRGKAQAEKKKELTKKIRAYIKENKGLMRKEVGEHFGISQDTLRVHLKIIENIEE